MLLNHLAAEDYSYNVVYHVRDLIKAALAEAVDQDVLERNVARKTVIPEIAEREKPVLPVEWYARLLAGLETARDRAIFLIACFCASRPSELFGLTWDSYRGNVFVIANTAWRGKLQRKKIKRKNRFGQTNFRLVAIPDAVGWAIEQWRTRCPSAALDALMFPGTGPEVAARSTPPCFPTTGSACVSIRSPKSWASRSTQPFRCCAAAFPPHGTKEAQSTEMQAQLGHSDVRTTLNIYTQTVGPEVIQMVNEVTNRILGLKQNGNEAVH
jgi:integrase